MTHAPETSRSVSTSSSSSLGLADHSDKSKPNSRTSSAISPTSCSLDEQHQQGAAHEEDKTPPNGDISASGKYFEENLSSLIIPSIWIAENFTSCEELDSRFDVSLENPDAIAIITDQVTNDGSASIDFATLDSANISLLSNVRKRSPRSHFLIAQGHLHAAESTRSWQ